MNSLEFTNFKLHADGTLKSMTKDELIRYIHTLHHNWQVTDEQMCNVIECNRKFENPRPYEFGELKKGMWVWDNKEKMCGKVIPEEMWKFALLCVPGINWGEYEPERFFPVQMANMKEVSK